MSEASGREFEKSNVENDDKIIHITINGKQCRIGTYFDNKSLMKYLARCGRSDEYRTPFAQISYIMYVETKSDILENDEQLTEQDFISADDEELAVLITDILAESEAVRNEYEQLEEENIFERFYIACSNAFSNDEKTVLAQNFAKSLAEVSRVAIDSVAETEQALISIARIAARYITPLTNALVKIGTRLAPIMKEVTDFLAPTVEWRDRNEVLKAYGWVYHDELPEELVNDIYVRRDDLNVHDVDTIITSYFRNEGCTLLKQMVKNWNGSKYLSSRKVIFHEALVNHSRRYYNTSITTLTLHIEGLLTDFTRLCLASPERYTDKTISHIVEALYKVFDNDEIYISDFWVYGSIIEVISATYAEEFDKNDPDAATNNSRHKIAHGHVVEKETEAASLKRFLYINELSRLFDDIDAMLLGEGEAPLIV